MMQPIVADAINLVIFWITENILNNGGSAPCMGSCSSPILENFARKYCRISFGFCIYPYCCFSWALSIFFPHRLHVACSFVISSWDSVCSSAISKKLVGSSEISERQSIYPPPTSCFLPWWSCMDFLLSLTIEEFLLTLSSNNIKCIFF